MTTSHLSKFRLERNNLDFGWYVVACVTSICPVQFFREPVAGNAVRIRDTILGQGHFGRADVVAGAGDFLGQMVRAVVHPADRRLLVQVVDGIRLLQIFDDDLRFLRRAHESYIFLGVEQDSVVALAHL